MSLLEIYDVYRLPGPSFTINYADTFGDILEAFGSQGLDRDLAHWGWS